jgi:adenylosuccinate synthase
VSDRAHLLLPYHRLLDAGHEDRLAKGRKIGTTKRGIGPAYADKASRVGLRVGDMLDPAFPEMLAQRVEEKNRILAALGAEVLDAAAVVAEISRAAEKIKPHIADTVSELNAAVAAGRSILFEGAQGTMLDIDFGTYPFVTSSSATSGGACTGTGVAPRHIHRILGVAKAYTTRVGEGPFPTELVDDVGKLLGKEGNEFGATTGRPRRCGWFDAVVVRYAVMVNGIDRLAVTKLDVLDTLPAIRLCTAYECDGKLYETIPGNVRILERCRPVYEEMPGWKTSTRDVTRLEDLPPRARAYVDRLCALSGASLGMLSIGPSRASTLVIDR